MKVKHASIKTPLLVIGFILFSFIIYMFGIVMGFNAGKQIKVDSYLTTIKEVTPVSELCESFLPPEQEEVYSYSGKIFEISENKIILETQIIENMNLVKKDITVQTDGNTEILKIDISAPPMPDEDVPEEQISFSDLKVDDQITAQSSENIKGKNKYLTNKILLIINSPVAFTE